MAILNVVTDYEYVGEMHYIYLDDKIVTWGDYDSGGLDLVDQVAKALGVTVNNFHPVDEAASDKMADPNFDFMTFSNLAGLLRPA